MLSLVSTAALIMSIVSFILFVICIVRPDFVARAGRDMEQSSAASDATKLATALTKLLEALGRAKPAALTIFASLIFMGIALFAAKG